MIDFHIHTTASDGQFSPSEVVSLAKEKSLTAIAITDHDTVSGLEEGENAAKREGLKFIKGIELNIAYPTGEFHLLGLGLKNISESLYSVIDFLQNAREERNKFMFEKMHQIFPDTSWEEFKNKFMGKTIGRPHFAQYMVEKKIVKKTQDAFNRYFQRGKPCYVPRTAANLDEAVSAINESGGVPVIAHPMSLYLSWGKLPNALKEIYEHGVKGLEAFHPGARNTDCFRLDEVAREIGFFITAGSDFHGEKVRSDRKLGYTCGGKKIDEKLIPEIYETLEKLFCV